MAFYLNSETGFMSIRVTSVIFPHRVRRMCTTKNTLKIIISLFIVAFLYSSHFLYGKIVEISKNGTSLCTIKQSPHSYWVFIDIYPWIHSVLLTLFPFVLLISNNSVLILKVRKSIREARLALSLDQAGHVTSRARKASSMTLTLIAVSSAFLLLTAPKAVWSIFFPVTVPTQRFQLVLNILWHIFLTNYAINFYVYCLTGYKFRMQARKLLCK